MIKAAIVDDEPFAVENIELLLQEYFPEITICGTANSLQEGSVLIKDKSPNILFLDIEMPFGSGFDLLKSFPNRNFQVIFVTAYNQYAIKALRCSAIDYLLKPIDIQEFTTAVSRAKENLSGNNQKTFDNLHDHLTGNSPYRIALGTQLGMEFIQWDQIIHIEADRSYSMLHLGNKETLLVSKSLREVEELLPPDKFFRPHKSHLIQLDKVKRYIKRENVIEMKDGSLVELSRRKKELFLEKMCR